DVLLRFARRADEARVLRGPESFDRARLLERRVLESIGRPRAHLRRDEAIAARPQLRPRGAQKGGHLLLSVQLAETKERGALRLLRQERETVAREIALTLLQARGDRRIVLRSKRGTEEAKDNETGTAANVQHGRRRFGRSRGMIRGRPEGVKRRR